MSITESESVRFCGACQKDVIGITPFGESQIIALFQVNPSACAHMNFHKALSRNQGYEYRLDSSNAMWDGECIIIDEP